MNIKAITIKDNEKFLRQKSKEVNLEEDDLTNIINDLDIYCKNNKVMAMAAIQLGHPKRVVYLKNTNLDLINKFQRNELTSEEEKYNEAKLLINPVVLKKEGLTEYWEACASCLDNFGHVRRAYKITIEYLDINGFKHKETFIGFAATVL